ncbi:PadR family transcriptional regulator [Dictyoglomus thermophilum]|uniref:Transcriptional regulator, PadR family n=1 Tax=Dictyoglomus thermophilum (strain ATCC 35947 / DSM 3960 / H-6-12) TaxID=309799 RepID=B5YBT8_DICT6|nr:PadR family transcriptional regulator [Dictyoglomus thermophilum]ACI19382.1 transcriptional regulator, PadR family [Dictyoglomus thermophilum H-6-12]MCX7720744.1 PadR family transcriptional regulator [Dictyoglomus thermophilum]TYT24121.1 PadR family transcriptional regulator [Dictyoglomus thermophilum]
MKSTRKCRTRVTGLSPTFWLRAWIVVSLSERELHGYELISSLSELFPNLLSPGIGGMGRGYRILKDLEEEGIIIGRWDVEGTGPAKKIYRLTSEGEKLREDIIKHVEEMQDYINKFLELTSKRF